MLVNPISQTACAWLANFKSCHQLFVDAHASIGSDSNPTVSNGFKVVLKEENTFETSSIVNTYACQAVREL